MLFLWSADASWKLREERRNSETNIRIFELSCNDAFSCDKKRYDVIYDSINAEKLMAGTSYAAKLK